MHMHMPSFTRYTQTFDGDQMRAMEVRLGHATTELIKMRQLMDSKALPRAGPHTSPQR